MAESFNEIFPLFGEILYLTYKNGQTCCMLYRQFLYQDNKKLLFVLTVQDKGKGTYTGTGYTTSSIWQKQHQNRIQISSITTSHLDSTKQNLKKKNS
jgi:hypothetical protein